MLFYRYFYLKRRRNKIRRTLSIRRTYKESLETEAKDDDPPQLIEEQEASMTLDDESTATVSDNSPNFSSGRYVRSPSPPIGSLHYTPLETRKRIFTNSKEVNLENEPAAVPAARTNVGEGVKPKTKRKLPSTNDSVPLSISEDYDNQHKYEYIRRKPSEGIAEIISSINVDYASIENISIVNVPDLPKRNKAQSHQSVVTNREHNNGGSGGRNGESGGRDSETGALNSSGTSRTLIDVLGNTLYNIDNEDSLEKITSF